MAIYMIHVPPDSRDDMALAERSAFVIDGFCWSAFFFGPLWLLRHRLWFAFSAWLLVVLILWAGAYWLGLSSLAVFLGFVAISLFFAVEGGALRASALRRRGFELADILACGSRDDAERLFYHRWMGERSAASERRESRARGVIAAQPNAVSRAQIIGVFPEAEA
ncbi:MAG: hypothetical protein NVSMB26_09090 [Beijerinckiaceae bacterium]